MSALDGNVLVLNRLYQPVNITTVRRAFALLYQGTAKAIDREFQTFDFESWAALSAEVNDPNVIRTVARTIRIPRVIILQVFERFPRLHVRFSRQNIYLRDKLTCQYCGHRFARNDLNLDHVIPRSRGGRTTWENVVCSCVTCNLKKGNRLPHEAGMRLLKAPSRPRWSPFERGRDGASNPEDWRPFLSMVDASYWHTELAEE
ncbi:MAG TPA: HNH endonuclease [Myxococcales bacterium LLY-WYZ-16_1]|jgi:5-methylcytosine-specific restriction endonuclease McrA|nr:HNH endonuclease [Myxococcales bacterium LLY-WYZ-16_1]